MYKILFATKTFFLQPRKLELEEIPFTGRVYFLLKGEIVAVALKR